MAQVCKVCALGTDTARQLEKEYLDGASKMSLSRKYKVGYDSVIWHLERHLTKKVVRVFEEKQLAKDFDMMQEFMSLITELKEQRQIYQRKNHQRLVMKATDTLIRIYQVMGQYAVAYEQSKATQNEPIVDKEEKARELEQKMDKLTSSEQLEFTRLVFKMNDMPWSLANDDYIEFEPTYSTPKNNGEYSDRASRRKRNNERRREMEGNGQRNATLNKAKTRRTRFNTKKEEDGPMRFKPL